VVHPTKTAGEMRMDIQACQDLAKSKHPLDAVATLEAAYTCLEERGYQSARWGFSSDVTRAVQEKARRSAPARACEVPCTGRPGTRQ